ncbi:DUF3551 domain-containing protein [Bradyrhizobium sp. ISRA443]|uniref:DUF3551 domain-containing protein n=1 Tax=unclassified Bradyrhizobium TaxID=2631580 RepID=UPI0024793CA6|nr:MULTISPECIES: DUF3551 domain-containing protein [unclassified Bradyrhizobium]WGS02366.1 DUF3551 domain-containing protein [Bradyrhizobium sp. ISRA436]WGS09251.1 DUF3551 domain-containing protein [Bradyrhizobium sp. ISRA437]WGS16140.1 DUF3551 domain-containing protein [Bradyrhizobium sp. ISRA443]
MRSLTLALFVAAVVASAPASAQKYDSTSPVCKTNYRWGGEDTNCGYTSMEQCRAAASGLPAMCFNNPYYVGLSADRPREPAKRRRPAY